VRGDAPEVPGAREICAGRFEVDRSSFILPGAPASAAVAHRPHHFSRPTIAWTRLLQELAAQQCDMLTRLVAVRGAIDGGSRCPSCYAHELGATNPAAQMDGSAHAGGVGVMEDRPEQASHRAASAAGQRDVCTSIALSPIEWAAAWGCREQNEGGGGGEAHKLVTTYTRTPDAAAGDEHWFTPMPVRADRVTPLLQVEPGSAAAGGEGGTSVGEAGAASAISPAPRPQLPLPQQGFRAVPGPSAAPANEGPSHSAAVSSGHSSAGSSLDRAAVRESSAVPAQLEAVGAAGCRQVQCVMSQEFAWELSPVAADGSLTDAPNDSAAPQVAVRGSGAKARTAAAAPVDTPMRIEKAFHALQDGKPLTELARAGPARSLPVEEGVALFSSSPPSATGTAARARAAAKPQEVSEAPEARMAARNSEDARRRISILARIEQLERSISDHVSNSRGSPVCVLNTHARTHAHARTHTRARTHTHRLPYQYRRRAHARAAAPLVVPSTSSEPS